MNARPSWLIVPAALLSACSGAASLPSRDAAAAIAPRVAKGTLVLHVAVPRTAMAKGMTLRIAAANLQTTISIEPNGAHCTNVPAGARCTIEFALAPARYTLTIATFDGVSCGAASCTIPGTAKELSANQELPFTLIAGKATTAGIALGVAPASIAIVPVTTTALAGSLTGGYTLTKCFASERDEVLGLDGSGNVIVGAGAPKPSLTSSDVSHLAVATPSPAHPNTFALSGAFASGTPGPTGVPLPGSVLTLRAKVTPLATSGAKVLQQNATVRFDRDVCGVVTSFVDRATIASYPDVTGITTGPDGALWFAENNADSNGQGAVGRISTAGAFAEYELGAGTGINHPAEVVSAYGSLWFSESGYGGIANVTTNGTPTEYTNGLSANPSLWGITKGPDGYLWFTNCTGTTVGKMTTTGGFSEFSTDLTAHATPLTIASGPDGNLWFTEYAVGKIGRVTTTGTIAEFSSGMSAGAIPSHIVEGPDKNLWFTDSAGRIGKITTGGAIVEYAKGIVAGASPASIAVGPDGNLWFAETGNGSIGKITTAGAVSQYSLGTDPLTGHSATPYGITTGPDGNLWVTDGGYAPKDPVIFRVQ